MTNLFDLVGDKVIIHQDLLGMPFFKELWEKDKADKEHSTNVIRYIVLKNKHNSPYVRSTSADEIESVLKDKIFKDKDYKLTPEELLCEEEFIGWQNTRILQLLTNMRMKLDSISAYYKDSLEDFLDEKKIKDLLAGMTSVGKVIESLSTLEEMVKAEQLVLGKVKGDAKVSHYELVR